jgi:hypothetical protein
MNSKKRLIGGIAVALICGILAAVAHRVRASSANSKSVKMDSADEPAATFSMFRPATTPANPPH